VFPRQQTSLVVKLHVAGAGGPQLERATGEAGQAVGVLSTPTPEPHDSIVNVPAPAFRIEVGRRIGEYHRFGL
jgi:hypothetical protein